MAARSFAFTSVAAAPPDAKGQLDLDGDGGDENLKDYPIEDNPELTIRSVLNNLMLYQEGWGVQAIKHSQTYSGGQSRGYARTYAPLALTGFVGLSPFVANAKLQPHALHLKTDRLSIPGATQQDVSELPARAQGMALALAKHIHAFRHKGNAERKPPALHVYDPVRTDSAAVAFELSGDANRPVDVAPACVGSGRR